MLKPRMFFLTAGVGSHEDPLVSFELALRDARIEKFNLVPVSSIIPPNCVRVSLEEGLKELSAGEIVFCVMAKHSSGEEGKKIYAAVGGAKPTNGHGYLVEYSGNYSGEDLDSFVKERAEYLVETSHGKKPVEVFSISKVAEVKKITTVVAAAVFVI